ncbi:MAG: glycoside hydrolase [Planctomycetes bacterium]|nr:glycoside hydrolase [Planctomycetota bacterium]
MRRTPTHVLAMLSCLNAFALAQGPASRPAADPFYSVARFGAVGDGRTMNTAAIQSAIDAAAAAGGGTAWFPAGTWRSGTLVLKDNVTLHLESGATLLGSTDLADYPRHRPAYRSYTDEYVDMALIYAEGARNVGVVGAGTIDGQGGDPAFKPPRGQNGYLQRPYLLRFVECRHVRVAGITLRDSPMWVQHYLACDNVTLERVTVLSNCNHNNDMIDIDGCRFVRIIGCTGESGDDAITLKSTGTRACENVTISDCNVASNCNAIKFGTESTGGFRNITITNCTVHRPSLPGVGRSQLSGISLLTVDGGTIDGVTISNIAVQGTQAPIFLRLGNRARKHTPDAPAPGVGVLRNVIISNVVATGATHTGCAIAGLPGHPIENVTLRDIRITFAGGGTLDHARRDVPEQPGQYPECTMFGTLPAYGFYVRHVDGLVLDNVQVGWEKPDRRPALVCDDVRNLTVTGLRAQAAPEAAETIVLKNSDTILIRGCTAPAGATAFLHLTDGTRFVNVIGNDLSRAAHAFRFAPGVDPHVLFEAANHLPAERP